MTKVLVTESNLDSIATAIRAKKGVQTTYKPGQMAAAIESIETPNLEPLTANANGTYTPSSGKNGFSGATVNVPNSYSQSDEGKVVSNGTLVAQTSKSVSTNGTYDTTENDEVVVSVPSAVLGTKNITENGTYNATSDSLDGFSSVVVNVAGGGGGSVHLTPYAYDITNGYVNGSSWWYSPSAGCYSDVYELEPSTAYIIFLGQTVSTRFRILNLNTDVTTFTGSSVNGNAVSNSRSDNPIPYTCLSYTTGSGSYYYKYLVITKSNNGTSGIETFVCKISDLMN